MRTQSRGAHAREDFLSTTTGLAEAHSGLLEEVK